MIEEKQAICGCQGIYTYIDTFFMKAGSPKALRKFSKSRMIFVECFYESRMTFIENSKKTG